ncbi:MAG: hypothetical protein SF172_18740 [Burkholderiales bacterium]|nr:hypothetical protein [Burkholderiales bacterium]
MSADTQYADAHRVLSLLEQTCLAPNQMTTYGSLCIALGYKGETHARHVGQVCSLIDAACFFAQLPFLSLEKVRRDDGEHNPDSFQKDWAPARKALIQNAQGRAWSVEDVAKIRRNLHNMNGESALLQWKRIEGFGQKGIDRALGFK